MEKKETTQEIRQYLLDTGKSSEQPTKKKNTIKDLIQRKHKRKRKGSLTNLLKDHLCLVLRETLVHLDALKQVATASSLHVG